MFSSGVKVLFRVGLVLIRLCLGVPEKPSANADLYAILEKIRHIPKDIDESFVVREVRYVLNSMSINENSFILPHD